MTIDQLVAFLGWCLVVNAALLFVSAVALLCCRTMITSVHAKLFGLREEDLGLVYFKWIAYYKIGLMLVNVAPYVALKIVASSALQAAT